MRQQLRELKAKHPGALVVCYVNSSAEVKAECDYCCTSANAVEVINSLPKDKEIIFVPDKYLGQYTAEKTGRKLILWPGYCPTHANISPDDLKKAKAAHPGAITMAHPECPLAIRELADQILSTSGMLKYAAKSTATTVYHCHRDRHYPYAAKAKPAQGVYYRLAACDLPEYETHHA